ncbi:MAG TPA: hypothetical protein VL100_06505 [Croceibacterium sp.]|nr:hypothetical protein [Croceibacterium sp.]
MLLLAAAPFAFLQAMVNSGADAPRWARDWNGFRMADDARRRLSGDPENPQGGLTMGAGAPALARAAYAREPLASDAVFVLALAQSPLGAEYQAGPTATLGAAIDKRNALLELLLIADAARRQDFQAMFGYADVLAAAHPTLARSVLAPLFDRLGDPAAMPIVATALANKARWAGAFKSYVPRDEAALRNYLALRRQAPAGDHWESDEKLVGALVDRRMYEEAFATWRSLAGAAGNQFGFVSDDHFAPIGWRLVVRGDRVARIGDDGTMTLSVERGAGGELARQLLDLPAGRYRLETSIASTDSEPPLWVELRCANAKDAPRQPLKAHVEFTVDEGGCPAYWLTIGASALESRHGVEATLGRWQFSRVN